MSSQANAKALIDRVASKGLAYAIGTYAYLMYGSDAHISVTLSKAFGEDLAQQAASEVYATLDPLYGKLAYDEVQQLSNSVYRKYIKPVIAEEAQRRLAGAGEDERKVLAAASAVIVAALEGRKLRGVSLRCTTVGREEGTGAVTVHSMDCDDFSIVVSAIVGMEVPDAREPFVKHLLGFTYFGTSRKHRFTGLVIYPDTLPLVELLAAGLPA